MLIKQINFLTLSVLILAMLSCGQVKAENYVKFNVCQIDFPPNIELVLDKKFLKQFFDSKTGVSLSFQRKPLSEIEKDDVNLLSEINIKSLSVKHYVFSEMLSGDFFIISDDSWQLSITTDSEEFVYMLANSCY